jgi:site-specific DNA-cytosine methylase
MGRVLDELADLGALGIEWATLDAQHFGVPQRRRRVFIVACFDPRIGSADPLLPVATRCQGHPQPGATPGQDVAGAVGSGLAHTRFPSLRTNAYNNSDLGMEAQMLVLEREREIVTALRASTGGPDDNRAQGGHLIVQHQSSPANEGATATMWTEQHG